MRQIISTIRWSLAAVLLTASLVFAVGCNTTEGAGEDIEAAGDKIADTARDVKN